MRYVNSEASVWQADVVKHWGFFRGGRDMLRVERPYWKQRRI